MGKRLVVILIAVACLLSACHINEDHPSPLDPTIASIVETLEQEDVESFTLTIHYLPWYIFTRNPWTVDQLIDDNSTEVVTLNKDEMAKTVQILKEELPTVTLEVPTEPAIRQFARLYYVFKVNGEKLFDVSFESITGDMFFNGTEIEYNELFYRVVEPYLTDFKRNV